MRKMKKPKKSTLKDYKREYEDKFKDMSKTDRWVDIYFGASDSHDGWYTVSPSVVWEWVEKTIREVREKDR